MTDEWGIDDRYESATGEEHVVGEATIGRLRNLIGRPPDGAAAGPLIARPGQPVPGGAADLVLEDGTQLGTLDSLPADLPFGYHRLQPLGGDGERRLIVTPGRCHLPADRRAWGWAVQLYATRSRASWGIGDLADLRRLSRWSAGELGAGFLLVNPLHAAAPTTPQEPSPYFPATRRFRNPIYLRVEDVPGAPLAGDALAAAAMAGQALNRRREINRDEVWHLKRTALEAIWAHTRSDAAFDSWRRAQDPSMAEFATWCVLAEEFGPRWRAWPPGYRRPDTAAVARFAAAAQDRLRFYCWLQWLLDRQLADAADALAVIQDLPIGVDPDGADAWAWQDLLADEATVGSPPDEFNVKGQDWGLPPFVPWRLRAADYQPFIDTIRATIATAGGLRVDHVMGLFRLWWIPAGADPGGGAYVRYPATDLLDIVALESQRAGAVVVGEDLGTVEPGVREAMAERHMLSYRLLWFETDEPRRWPATAMAAVTTHDLPTVAGLWDDSDLAEQHRLGLDPKAASIRAIRDRLAAEAHLDEQADASVAVVAAHELLARSPAVLLCATLDDAVAEPARPNMPGADDQRPNWRLALPVPLEELEHHPLARRVAGILRGAVDDAGNPSSAPDERTGRT